MQRRMDGNTSRGRHAGANENIEISTMTYSHNFLTAKTTAVIAEEG